MRAAWNVLADPFQRSRYDERVGTASTNGDVSDHDDDVVDVERRRRVERRRESQLTGWRKLMAPPPPKKPAAGAGNGKNPPPPRPLKEPTIPIPPGMRLADSRSRGMALLFDFAVVLVIYWVVLLVVPGIINSDYQTKVDQIDHLNSLHDAQNDIDDAQIVGERRRQGDHAGAEQQQQRRPPGCRSRRQGVGPEGPEVGAERLRRRRRRRRAGRPPGKHNADAIQKQADKLGDDIRGAQYGSYLVVLVLALLYLVPATAITGRTLGMRGRKIRIVRVDGTPVGWYGVARALPDPDRGRARDPDDRAADRSRPRPVGLPRTRTVRASTTSWRGRSSSPTPNNREPRTNEVGDKLMRYVHAFEEGSKEQKFLLGGKGANLAEMTNLGLPVPPGFTITTEACNAYMAAGDVLPDGLMDEVAEARTVLEGKTGSGSAIPSTRCWCRCARVPRSRCRGMMDTVLNLGLNDVSVGGLAQQTSNERFAWDSYRRFVQMFGKIVLDIDGDKFEHALTDLRDAQGVATDPELSAEALQELVGRFKAIVLAETGVEFPQDPQDQLRHAIEAVFRSWNGDRARIYRREEKIPDDLGTAVNVQTMVFGNKGDDSGTGVAFTRDPATGENRPYGDFLANAQGEDVVAGIRATVPLEDDGRTTSPSRTPSCSA